MMENAMSFDNMQQEYLIAQGEKLLELRQTTRKLMERRYFLMHEQIRHMHQRETLLKQQITFLESLSFALGTMPRLP